MWEFTSKAAQTVPWDNFIDFMCMCFPGISMRRLHWRICMGWCHWHAFLWPGLKELVLVVKMVSLCDPSIFYEQYFDLQPMNNWVRSSNCWYLNRQTFKLSCWCHMLKMCLLELVELATAWFKCTLVQVQKSFGLSRFLLHLIIKRTSIMFNLLYASLSEKMAQTIVQTELF